MNSSDTQKITALGKEFWGILMFELNLPALAELLRAEDSYIGLNRLADWVLFPDKIPPNKRDIYLYILEHRHRIEDYHYFVDRPMDDTETRIHQRTVELLQLKYAGSTLSVDYYYYLYELTPHVFYILMLRLVEKGYVTAAHMANVVAHYQLVNKQESA